MKKRKIKLFASIASLALVVAVMGVGVWAATNASLAVTTKVSFTATSGVRATVKLLVDTPNGSDSTYDISKAEVASNVTDGANAAATSFITSSTLWSKDTNNATDATNYSAVSAEIVVDIADKGTGYLPQGATLVYTFEITNDNTTRSLYYKIAPPTTAADGWTLTSTQVKTGSAGTYAAFAADSGKSTKAIAKGTSEFVQITLTCSAAAYQFTNAAAFNSITFNFYNSAQTA